MMMMPCSKYRYFLLSMVTMSIILCTMNLKMLRVYHKSIDGGFINDTPSELKHTKNENSTKKNQQRRVVKESGSNEVTRVGKLKGSDKASTMSSASTRSTFYEHTSTASINTDNNPLLPNNITTLTQAREYRLAPLPPNSIHNSQYTIRMNTWHRNEQLIVSINHHAKCQGVEKIQIVWCDMEHDPPYEVANHTSGKVVIERHTINSLNERYNILIPTPTLGILSLDDDVLRPCEALDATFVRWTRHPDRIVGFNARSHDVGDSTIVHDSWTYNNVGKSNKYSITLPSKSCFIHRDYLKLYIATLPLSIYEYINEHFNCEDIAMSYFVSTLTGGRPPLLADKWAIDSYLQTYSQNGLSWKTQHMNSRDSCVNDFAELLGLKERGSAKQQQDEAQSLEVYPLQFGMYKDKEKSSCLGTGDESECWSDIDPNTFSHAPRLHILVKELQWRESLPDGLYADNNTQWLTRMREETESGAKKAGLVKYSIEWKMRWWMNCITDLKNDKRTKQCFTKPAEGKENSTFFVCDIRAGILMHADTLSEYWMFATPPKGMGTRQYASYLDYKSPCENVGPCPGCILPATASVNLCTVTLNPENCSLEVLNHDHLNGSLPSSNQIHPGYNNSVDKEAKLQNVSNTPQQKDPNAINSEMSNSGHSGDHNVCPWTDNDRIMNSPCDLQLL